MNEPLSEVIRIRVTPSHAARLDEATATCGSHMHWRDWNARSQVVILQRSAGGLRLEAHSPLSARFVLSNKLSEHTGMKPGTFHNVWMG